MELSIILCRTDRPSRAIGVLAKTQRLVALEMVGVRNDVFNRTLRVRTIDRFKYRVIPYAF
jgi:hypothetical protein